MPSYATTARLALRKILGTSNASDLDTGIGAVADDVEAALAHLVPIGGMLPWAGAGASLPFGWLYCDGRAVSRSTFAALYAVIGTAYGVGDGSTTFNVPDARGRVLVMEDAGAGRLATANTRGATGGAETHQHQHISPVGARAGLLRVLDPTDGTLDWNGSSYSFLDAPGDTGVEIGAPSGNSAERHVVTSTAASTLQPGLVIGAWILRCS
ncbi:tail fiber protein [Baekduia soli]|uniref:Tail fiber protein n=2 Tax=Baekduia soli TaxID=496014 RepID=A0A5B8UCR2_9ACTN|nr:tail fiber protein [Baekduia soli]